MLDQKRYTWCQDNILQHIPENINNPKYTVYCDIEGAESVNGGTIHPNLTVTPPRPNIVILNDNNVNMFELTSPFETNIEKQHTYKTNKYSHLLKDITSMNTTLEAFEIGSRGIITSANKDRLRKLYRFIDNNITLKTFVSKISEIAISSSYYIFIQRKNPSWISPGPLTIT